MNASIEPSKATILVVEDNDDLNLLLAEQLRIFGFNPVAMKSGIEALEWLRHHPCDLVLLDWMLPDIDGFQICQRIREHYTLNTLPIVMLSAYCQQPDRRVVGLDVGANDIMLKPYDLKELVARINTQLRFKSDTERMVHKFSEYTARTLHPQISRDPDRLSTCEERDAVILFADLRGFTCLAAAVPPQIILPILDSFFDTMMQVVQAAQGCVLDITGDELLVLFDFPNSLPDASTRAVKTAVSMQERFAEVKKAWPAECGEVGLGLGIHQGKVMLGELGGSELKRFTVLGNVVNIAHRLVEQARSGEIVMSIDTYSAAREAIGQRPMVSESVLLKGTGTLTPILRLPVTAPTTGTGLNDDK